MYLKAITHNRNDWIIHQCFSNLLNDGTCLVDATSDAICNQFSISRVSAIGSNTLKWERIWSVLLNKRNQRGRKTTSATGETEDLRKRAGKGGNVRAEGSGRRREEVGAGEREGCSPAPPGLTSCLIILDLCNQREAGGGHSCAPHILISSNLARPGAALRRAAAAHANGACGSEPSQRRAWASLWAPAQSGLQVEMDEGGSVSSLSGGAFG